LNQEVTLPRWVGALSLTAAAPDWIIWRMGWAVRAAGILRFAAIIGVGGGPLAACTTYDESLLKYMDAAGPDQDASIETGPEASPDGDANDGSPEPDVDATDEADVQAEVDALPDVVPEAEVDAPEEPSPCSATSLDCDGDSQNGCETDITKSGAHCGKCQHDCLGGACEAGVCMPVALATGQSSPSGMAIDQGSGSTGRVYWTNRLAAGSVASVAKSGGEVTLHAESQDLPSGLVVDAANVYWVNAGTAVGQGQVMKASKSAGDAGAPEQLLAGQHTPTGLAIAGSRLFWTNSFNNTGSVNAVDVSGANMKVLVPDQDTPTGIAADETGVYWAVLDDDEIRRCYDQCTTVKLVASGLNNPAVVTVDTMHAFWTEVGGSIRSWNKVTSEVVELASGQALPMGLTVDGAHLYWANNVGNTIARVPKGGGPVEVVATGQNGPFSVAVDNDAVYWVNQGNGTVMKWAK